MASHPERFDPDPQLAAATRHTAREIFLGALTQCSIGNAFDRHLEYGRGVLRIGDDLYDLSLFSRTLVVALGKAAIPMAAGLHQKVGNAAGGILVAPASAKAGTPMLPGFSYFFGGHPLPDAESIRAGGAILKALRADHPQSLVIYLLSGGGSAMVEKPVSDDISLDDVILTYRALVHSGAPIAEINAIRKHLSAVKGGRMAQAAEQGGASQQVSIMVSDVPDSALDALASGPTMPDSSTAEDCYRIAREYELQKFFPASVKSLFAERGLEETPKNDDGIFARARWWPVLSNADLQRAAAAAASRAGFAVEVDNSCDDWDFASAADYLLQRLNQLRQGVSRVCLISGGEVTVRVPAEASGTGGRNQHFALYCAEKIAGQNTCVLSAGSDGIDGNSPAAGAIADGGTVSRAQSEGLDSVATLAGFDAFTFFNRLGDTIMTGPTGNNIRDLRILLAY